MKAAVVTVMRAILAKGRHVMSTTNGERQSWTWISDIIWVLVYSTLVTFFMLSWAAIPA